MTITAAVIGTGFIGTVHIGALRRLGVTVAGVLGSSPDRAGARAAALGLPRAYASLDDLLADGSVDVVHVTSPNDLHYPQVKAILAAGKHVICEKPLAMTAAQSAEMVTLARDSGRIAAVCYNIRFYPLNQHARGLVASGALGEVRLITGHYHQDWLAKDTDWNWRLVPEAGGTLRSVGDIGTHWLDLVTFIAGERPTHVLADLQTFIPVRQRPTGPVETFAAASGATVPENIATDDAAQMLLRFASGARAVFTTSQVSHGRKNSLRWDITGSRGSAAWDSETPDHLWLGHRDAPNQILQRDAGLMLPLGGAAASLPPGHVEGFADSFHSFFRAVYTDIAVGRRGPDSTWATFEDGHAEMAFCDAVIESARSQTWTPI
jgi:predicted dehydrogenase